MSGEGLYVEPRMQISVVAGPSNSKQQHPCGTSANVNGWDNKYNDKQWEHDIRCERKLERERFRECEVRE